MAVVGAMVAPAVVDIVEDAASGGGTSSEERGGEEGEGREGKAGGEGHQKAPFSITPPPPGPATGITCTPADLGAAGGRGTTKV